MQHDREGADYSQRQAAVPIDRRSGRQGQTKPAQDRRPMKFTEVYLGHVTQADFRKNPRGELGTRTATVDRQGIQKLRSNWVYLLK